MWYVGLRTRVCTSVDCLVFRDKMQALFQLAGVNPMTRQQRIHLAQRARSMAYGAWWQAVCEQVDFSLYDARKAPKIIL